MIKLKNVTCQDSSVAPSISFMSTDSADGNTPSKMLSLRLNAAWIS